MGRKKGVLHGQVLGAYMCKSYLLMTPSGQAFLKAVVGGLIEDFLHSSYFWEKMKTPLVYWIVKIVDSCFTQLKLDDERMSEIGPTALFKLLSESTPTLESRVPDPPHESWYLRCLREAAHLLSSSDADANSFPAWEEILFLMLKPEAGKFELLRGLFDETKNMSPAFWQELAEAEQQAALAFHQRLLQRRLPSVRPEDSDSQNRQVPCPDSSAADSYQILSEPQDGKCPFLLNELFKT